VRTGATVNALHVGSLTDVGILPRQVVGRIVSLTVAWNIINHNLGLQPYHLQVMQLLSENDKVFHVQCEMQKTGTNLVCNTSAQSTLVQYCVIWAQELPFCVTTGNRFIRSECPVHN
jgi:hypothetical protein